MSQDWVPASNEEKALKDAVTTLQTSINSVVKDVDKPDVPSRFVLNSKGYFDLRAYVMSGRDFPKSDSEFEALMPQKAFVDITTFDNTIYPLTKKTMVGIGSSCSDYYNNQLARLVNAAAAAVQYADNTTELLTVADDINLRHHLDIILQDKYKTKADQDSAFKESREAALMTIALLKDDAETKKKEVDDIRARLLTLKSTTQTLQPDFQKVAKQFKTGPVENNSTDPAKKKPYLEQLNSKYNAKVNEIKKQLEEAKAKYSEWELKTGLAVGFVAWPGVGWIVMSVMAAQAAGLRKAYNELKDTIADGEKENAETMRVVRNVTTLIEQATDIDGKMSSAITAMGELSELFGNHATCYEKIAFYLNAMDSGVKSDSGNNRRAFVNLSLKKTVEWLGELKTTALEFQKNIVREIKI